MTPDVQQKLADPELLDLARSASDSVVSVIVELSLPRRTVAVETGEPGKRPRVRIVEPSTAIAPEEVLAGVGDRLRELSGRPVVELDSARALVAQLDGSELVAAAGMPDVRRILPNRKLKKSSRHLPM